MSRLARYSAYLMSTVGAVAWGQAAQALDLLSPTPVSQQAQAVSAFNGQWVFELGTSTPGGALLRGTGSLTTPIDNYGLQGDFSFSLNADGGLSGAFTAHAFARDPSAGWMIGLTKGIVVTPDAALVAVGPEGELYLDRLSLEGWAGLAAITDFGSGDFETGIFAFGDAAFYPDDDLRLVVGGSTLFGNNQLHLATEYLLRDMDLPISLIADARIGADSSVFTIGLHGYFGGDDDNKTLILHHREDNLRLRSLDLWASALPIASGPPFDPPPSDPEMSQEVCEDIPGAEWVNPGCYVLNVPEPYCEWLIDNTDTYQYFEWVDGECVGTY